MLDPDKDELCPPMISVLRLIVKNATPILDKKIQHVHYVLFFIAIVATFLLMGPIIIIYVDLFISSNVTPTSPVCVCLVTILFTFIFFLRHHSL